MVRNLALAASLFVTGGIAISAQTHPPSHPQGPPHDGSGHVPMDAAQHAALHGLLDGAWHGALSSPADAPEMIDLNVARDDAGKLTVRMVGRRSAQLGAASQVAVDGDTV